MKDAFLIGRRLIAWERRTLIIGFIALALLAIGAIFDLRQALRSWLLGWAYWSNIAFGSLVLLMLQYMVNGEWGYLIRRPLEAGARLVPLMLLAFAPLLLGMGLVYPWTQPDQLTPLVEAKLLYLNPTFFTFRWLACLFLWTALAWALVGWSRRRDLAGTARPAPWLVPLSVIGMIVYFLTFTFAATDWLMSLSPRFFSSIYPVILIVGQALSALALGTVAVLALARTGLLGLAVRRRHINDLGNLLMAFVLLWSYMGLMQFIIIWMANMREDNNWFIERNHGGWQWLALALAVLHFALPFLVLLHVRIKQDAAFLLPVAVYLLVVHALHFIWLVVPSLHPGRFYLHWMDLLAPLAIGGIWLALWLRELRHAPLLALNDPAFTHLLEAGNEHQRP